MQKQEYWEWASLFSGLTIGLLPFVGLYLFVTQGWFRLLRVGLDFLVWATMFFIGLSKLRTRMYLGGFLAGIIFSIYFSFLLFAAALAGCDSTC